MSSDGGGGIASLLATQHFLEEIESLGVVADQDDLVVRLRMYAVQESDVVQSAVYPRRCDIGAHLSSTRNLPPHSQLTIWFRPRSRALAPAPLNPSGRSFSEPRRSPGRSRSSGWLHSFLRILIALSGCESVPRSRAWISGEEMNGRYSANWKSDNLQNTTCSYLTGTVCASRSQSIVKIR